jgi:DNA-binding NarL/FixJ family response regulator
MRSRHAHHRTAKEGIVTALTQDLQVLVVERRALVLDGLRTLIDALDGIRVTGEAIDGDHCMDAVRDLVPDVVVASAQLPRISGLDLIHRLRGVCSATSVVLIERRELPDAVAEAVQAGAAGVVMERERFSELAAAIRAAGKHRLYLSPHANTLFTLARASGCESGVLTPRQREVAQLLAEGFSTKQIAYRLSLSVKTIATHRDQLLVRLRIRSIADLTRYAIRAGIIEP